jgi:exodeoxyribonuclease-3
MKILNWNIQSGGGKKIERIVERISLHNPDLLVLTEFREAKQTRLTHELQRAGFEWIETSSPQDKENGILVASKYGFVPSEIGSHDEDPQRWFPLYFPMFGIHLVAVHVPGSTDHKFVDGVGISGGARKKIFWQSLIGCASKYLDERMIFVGDFNTGLPEDSEGMPFTMSKYMKELLNIGYVDAWRAIHKNESEFTWYSRRKVEGVTRDFNGFRLDYFFVSQSLSDWITGAYHSHDERTQNISDHSAVICELAPLPASDEERMANPDGRYYR